MDVATLTPVQNNDEPDLEAGKGESKIRRLKTQAALVAVGAAKPSSLVQTVSMGGVCAVGAVTAVTSSLLTDPFIVDAASLCTVGFAPYVVVQKRKIDKLGSMKDVQDALRAETRLLKKENDQLTASIDEFSNKIDRLKDVEAGFQEILAASNYNGNSLITLTKETKRVIKEMEYVMKARLMQDVLSNLLRGDRSNDFTIDETEMEIIILRMSMQTGVRFNEDSFRKKLTMTDDRSINTLMKILRNITDDNPDDDDQLFSIDTNAMIL